MNRHSEALTKLVSDFVNRFRSSRMLRGKWTRQYRQGFRNAEFLETRTLLSAVNISVDTGTASEQDGNSVAVTATAEEAVVGDQTITVALSGTGITSGDLAFPNTTITILDGETAGTTTFTANDDGELEVNETATLTLTDFSEGVSAGSVVSTSVTIVDNKQESVILDTIDRFPGRQPTLTWQDVAGAARYELWFSRLSPATSRIISDTQITANSYTIPQTLDAGMYRYWVRAFDSHGDAAGWSSAEQFEVQPTLLGPATPTFSSQPTFSWDAIPLATDYEIFIRTSEGDIVVSDIEGTEYTHNESLPQGSIRWWIRAGDSLGNFGWSDVGITSIVDRTTLLGPTETVTTRRPTLEWETVSDASRYIVHVQSDDTSEVVLRQNHRIVNSYTFTSELANGDYTFWVKAIDAATNDFGDSAWSFPLTFTVDYVAPPIEVLTAQLLEAVDVADDNSLSSLLLTAINEHTEPPFSKSMIRSSLASDLSMTALATVSQSITNADLAAVTAFFPDNVHPGEMGFLWDDVLAEINDETASQLLADTIAQHDEGALALAFADVISTALDDQAIAALVLEDGTDITNETALTLISDVINALSSDSDQVTAVLDEVSTGFPSIGHNGRVFMINRLFSEIDDNTLISIFTAVAEPFGF